MHLLHTIFEWPELIIDVSATLEKALSHPGPALVEVMTDAELV